jgi:hypothetical protein
VRDIADTRRQRLEDWVEPLYRLVRAADHHAVAAFQAPDAAAGPDIHIVNTLRHKFLGAADVVHVVGIAPVDEDVPFLEMGQEVGDCRVRDCRRDHQPECARLLQLLDEVRERSGPNHLWRPVEDHAVMASFEKPAHHVGPHPAESDHSELHRCLLFERFIPAVD